MPTTKEIIAKYSRKLESEIESSPEQESSEYTKFKQEMIPELSRYERLAKSLGGIVKIKIAEKDREKVQRFLNTAKLDVTAAEALTLSLLSMLGIFFLTILAAVAIYLIAAPEELGNLVLFVMLGLTASSFVFYYTYSMPKRLANIWRLQTSSQMVPAILYTVVYMEHTSNLERAIHFASEHLEGPLALDFKKILYDVEIGKFSTIKHSLDAYLETWRDYAPEFIESFHLIESSLFEPSEARRIIILEKALQVILDGVYEKMLKYTREIRTPMTNIYMLGIILPTLGLALLPLASTLVGDIMKWYHIALIFNILIPFLVFYMISEVLLKRPGGYGESQLLESSPDYPKFISRKPWFIASLIAIPLLILGLLPFLFQIDFITSSLGIKPDYTFGEIGISLLSQAKLFDFITIEDKTIGPFSPLAVLLSLFIPLAIGLFFSIAYKQKTKSLIKARENTKSLESEFTNSIFQLGNRLGDGVPAEIAFGNVAEQTQNQVTHDFFSMVNQNIQQAGMSVERAIFDKKRGALIFFPSALIATSMKILVESVKKGLQVAARSLMAISEYIKNINKINERLKDLLAEIVTDMKSNMTFLAPLLAGIVVGLSAMITSILSKLQTLQASLGSSGELSGIGSLGNIMQMFDIASMVPPYFVQASVGLYVVEIVFILTTALVTIEAGRDILREKYELSLNLKRSLALYLITALISIVALTLLATVALGNLAG